MMKGLVAVQSKPIDFVRVFSTFTPHFPLLGHLVHVVGRCGCKRLAARANGKVRSWVSSGSRRRARRGCCEGAYLHVERSSMVVIVAHSGRREPIRPPGRGGLPLSE